MKIKAEEMKLRSIFYLYLLSFNEVFYFHGVSITNIRNEMLVDIEREEIEIQEKLSLGRKMSLESCKTFQFDAYEIFD